MVEFRPFKALMFDWDDVDGDPPQVTSPPYDVLSPDDIARLKKLSVHNVTHVTLPDPVPGKEDQTKYQQAAKTLRSWRKDGILHQRNVPAFFVYEESYLYEGGRRTMRGVVGLLGLDHEYRHVHPHERTHKGPIADRLELLRATATDLEPIQFLFKDPEREVDRILTEATDGWTAEPLLAFEDGSGGTHRVWPIEDAARLERIHAFFAERDVYIADGHHRYATALHYAQERRAEESGVEGPRPYDYKLSVLVDRDDPGLSVFPTHRLLQGLEDPGMGRERLRETFVCETIAVAGEAAERGRRLAERTREVDRSKGYRFVFYWGDGDADIVTVPVKDVPKDRLGPHSDAWKALDVVVLHHVVLPPTLGVDDRNAGEHLRYTRVDKEAVAWVDEGRYQVAVFMNPTPLAAVTEVADQGETMPQKSTYFQPKLQSGLFFSALK
jgi:uncharacterized protein (DUF1015 family)